MPPTLAFQGSHHVLIGTKHGKTQSSTAAGHPLSLSQPVPTQPKCRVKKKGQVGTFRDGVQWRSWHGSGWVIGTCLLPCKIPMLDLVMANMSCKLGMLDKSYHWDIVGSLGHCWDAMYTNSRIKNSRVSKGSEFWKDMLQAMAGYGILGNAQWRTTGDQKLIFRFHRAF